jgi:hypothetical protein
VNRLLRLYPRAWRDRYGDELAALVADLTAERDGRFRLALDLVRGALDAHFSRRHPMRRFLSDAALRRGCYDGLVIAAVLALLVVLTNVVFPQGPNESDDDPEYMWQILTVYLLMGAAFMLIGARGARRSGTSGGGFRAGAAAGLVVACLGILEFLIVNNVFFSIISQQHDKLVAFHDSGATSMRAFVNQQLLAGAGFAIPAGTLVAGVLGWFGGTLGRRTRPLGT